MRRNIGAVCLAVALVIVASGCASSPKADSSRASAAPPTGGVDTAATAESRFHFPTLGEVWNDTVCAFNLASLFYRSTLSGSSQPPGLTRTFFTCASP